MVALLLLLLFVAGFWMLNQTLDTVVILGRNFVNLPSYPLPIDVWTYHDGSYTLLWTAYLGLVIWEITPWKPGHLTSGRIIIALLGFATLTAGLWLAQDTMNAVLVLNRKYVDFPFFLASGDIYVSRDISILLVALGFVGFHTLVRVSHKQMT